MPGAPQQAPASNWQLEQLNAWDAVKQLARWLSDALAVAQLAGVVVGDPHRERAEARAQRRSREQLMDVERQRAEGMCFRRPQQAAVVLQRRSTGARAREHVVDAADGGKGFHRQLRAVQSLGALAAVQFERAAAVRQAAVRSPHSPRLRAPRA